MRSLWGERPKIRLTTLSRDSIFMNLSKAFDTVDHKILFDKLYGFCGVFHIGLLVIFLIGNNRPNVSSYERVVCGVPQGSSLGALLFIVYNE